MKRGEETPLTLLKRRSNVRSKPRNHIPRIRSEEKIILHMESLVLYSYHTLLILNFKSEVILYR